MRECILASASPRRKEILAGLGIRFEVFVTDADEHTDERDPEKMAEEVAARKGRAAWRELTRQGRDLSGKLIIASDTAVAVDDRILGKPADETDARAMLRLLAGRSHRVVSGIWLCMDGIETVSHAVTEVEFEPMSDAEIETYIRTGEPFGKAGAYAIQGKAAMWIRGIRGDYFNVVGLPVNRMCRLFSEKFGENFL